MVAASTKVKEFVWPLPVKDNSPVRALRWFCFVVASANHLFHRSGSAPEAHNEYEESTRLSCQGASRGRSGA
jgi:hypothetical protein